jgi:hypothetical protein
MVSAAGELVLIIEEDEADPEAAELLVDGCIGGREYRFLLDTGAARSAVVWDDYTSRFDSHEKSTSSGAFGRRSREDLIRVPSIAVGPISRRDFTLVRLPRQGLHGRNLIGMDLLKEHRCHFCFDEERVLVDGYGEKNADLAVQELLLDARYHPYVDLHVRTLRARAVWDTGAGMTVVDTNFVARHPALFHRAGESTGRDASGFEMETPTFIMEESVIGERTFPTHKVAGVDLSAVNATLEMPMDFILGYNTLRRADWLFDFPNRRWAITPCGR